MYQSVEPVQAKRLAAANMWPTVKARSQVNTAMNGANSARLTGIQTYADLSLAVNPFEPKIRTQGYCLRQPILLSVLVPR